MEFLYVIGIIIWAIAASVSKAKKAQSAQSAQNAQKGKTAAHTATSQGATRKPSVPRANAPKSSAMSGAGAQAHKGDKPKPRPQATRPVMQSGSLGEYTPMQSTEGMSGYTPITHRLDTSSHRPDMVGSLGVDSTEGIDICDPTLEHGVKQQDAQTVYTDAIGSAGGLRFDRQALLQGVIMSEILTRPSMRRRGGQAHG